MFYSTSRIILILVISFRSRVPVRQERGGLDAAVGGDARVDAALGGQLDAGALPPKLERRLRRVARVSATCECECAVEARLRRIAASRLLSALPSLPPQPQPRLPPPPPLSTPPPLSLSLSLSLIHKNVLMFYPIRLYSTRIRLHLY